MFTKLIERVRGTTGGGARGEAERRGGSIDAAVAWWLASLRDRGCTNQTALDAFGSALARDLTEELDKTYRVYLEVNHQPKGMLRAAALASGLDVDSFPPATTMSNSPARISWSASAIASRPDRQTLLIVSAGTLIGMPALTAAWRAGI